MRVTRVAPSACLAPFVREFLIVEAETETTRALVPDGSAFAGFRFGGSAHLLEAGGPVRTPDASFAGPRRTFRRMRTAAGGGVVLAAFHEHAAHALVRAPMEELFGATLPLDALLPRAAVRETAERIADARDHAARVARFEEFLCARVAAARADPLVAVAVRAIRASPATVRVAALARALGLSTDRLEKRFRRVVGAPPKQLASILRLRRAVDGYRAGASLARVAADAGYFDQSHFNRAFRAVAGEAPGRFFAADEHC